MSEIYHWFTTSEQGPIFCFGKWYISEHAQKPLVLMGEDEAFASCHRSVTCGF